MKLSNLKDKSYSISIGISLIVLGIIFITVSPKALINFVFYVVGTIMVLLGILTIVLHAGRSTYGLCEGIVELLMGIVLIFYHDKIFTIIVGALMIALPVIKAFLNKGKTLQSLYKSLPLMVLGLVLIFASDVAFKIAFVIFGVCMILLGIYYLLPPKWFKPKHTVDKSNSIDVESE